MLPYKPARGEVLICDFDSGFSAPEMVKKRPVVVVSTKDSHGRLLCTVVPFSTTAPVPVHAWHHPLPHIAIPGWKPSAVMWAKADMWTTVGFRRLNKPYLKSRSGGRRYQEVMLSEADMAAISAGLRAYLAL